MKFALLVFAALLPSLAYSIGEAEWPNGAILEVRLTLAAKADKEGQAKISGDLVITNPSDTPLTIQSPGNRLALAFLVFDPLGNPVAPEGLAKVNMGRPTLKLEAHSSYTHHLESLEFVTGSIQLGYELSPGKTYKVLAVYRPAGAEGPGFATQEVNLEIPQ